MVVVKQIERLAPLDLFGTHDCDVGKALDYLLAVSSYRQIMQWVKQPA